MQIQAAIYIFSESTDDRRDDSKEYATHKNGEQEEGSEPDGQTKLARTLIRERQKWEEIQENRL